MRLKSNRSGMLREFKQRFGGNVEWRATNGFEPGSLFSNSGGSFRRSWEGRRVFPMNASGYSLWHCHGLKQTGR
jgi:hypothetical protein